MRKINIEPVIVATRIILACDPLNHNAAKLLTVAKQLQHQAKSPWIDEDVAKAHALEKRLSSAITQANQRVSRAWTDEEQSILAEALLAVDQQPSRDQRLQVRLTDDEMVRLRELAQAAGQTVGAYVREKLGLARTEGGD